MTALFCAIFLLALPSFTDASTRQERFSHGENLTFVDNILFSTTARSKIDCARQCQKTKMCVTFTYTNETCNLHCNVMASRSPFPSTQSSEAFTLKQDPAASCGEQDNEGWTVIQRRASGAVDFDRGWTDYVNGFGETHGECWFGLENLYSTTMSAGPWTLRVDLGDWECNQAYATYTGFYITSSADNYRLMFDAGSYSGDAGDCLAAHNGAAFSTPDADNDAHPLNCAADWLSGWWYRACMDSNLNGVYLPDSNTATGLGIMWPRWKGIYSMRFSEMRIRLE